ncbi:NYN domain-containing protein [Actinoplanes regularis]|uniref:Uncharacterized protein n=1 Tax=Actinoplanes regularis TaxID=52697 RepID=A0A238YB46_9ACTN|nr:NYN domain-containing protein [Actinoplanes regularis]GIE86019.1 hypothetical protein Are01nite_24990 [Actinoplanes regularis]SNR68496.1 hypothetical protein SAMN06264365_104429 [Actinoplanes regularis]
MTSPQNWPGCAAAVWSLTYAMLGLNWWAGGDGFPFAPVADDRRSGSILEGAPVDVVAPIMTIWGLLGVLVAVALIRSRRRHVALLAFGWVTAAVLTLVLPDYFLIGLLVLAPALVVFAFTGVPGPQDGLGEILYWHRVNLVILFVGGVLWAVATLIYQRRARGACVRCGRGAGVRDASPERLLRWGRWAVLVAVVAPMPYEITRIAWYLGYPMGISSDFLRMMQDTDGMLAMGLGFAVASMLGGVLTHGLVASWGERYPRWIWWKAGRPVPIALAVVPGTLVAVLLIPAGLMNLRMPIEDGMWAPTAPSVLWAVWGAALGVAVGAYYLRRRPTCRSCGRGSTAGADERPDSRAESGSRPPAVGRVRPASSR